MLGGSAVLGTVTQAKQGRAMTAMRASWQGGTSITVL